MLLEPLVGDPGLEPGRQSHAFTERCVTNYANPRKMMRFNEPHLPPSYCFSPRGRIVTIVKNTMKGGRIQSMEIYGLELAQPGLEPGASAYEAEMLPLHHRAIYRRFLTGRPARERR